jgi:hypothetical protein
MKGKYKEMEAGKEYDKSKKHKMAEAKGMKMAMEDKKMPKKKKK